MAEFIIKKWMYEKTQNSASRYNFTVCWAHMVEKQYTEENAKFFIDCGMDAEKANKIIGVSYYVEDTSDTFDSDLFAVYGTVEKETEKAVLLSLNYWNLNRAGRYITDAPLCKGFKAWMPKSAIINGLN